MTNIPSLPLSRAAFFSLILGILALVTSVVVVGGLLGIIAIILAIAALGGFSKRQSRGKAFAIIGLVTGGVGFVVAVGALLIWAVMVPALAKARDRARVAAAESNLRGIGVSMMEYSADNDGYLPPHLTALFTTGAGVSPRQLIDPRTGTTAASLPSTVAAAGWRPYVAMVDAHCDFVYTCACPDDPHSATKAGGQRSSDYLYDRKPTRGGYIVLCADCHIELVPAPVFATALQAINDARATHGLAPLPQPLER